MKSEKTCFDAINAVRRSQIVIRSIRSFADVYRNAFEEEQQKFNENIKKVFEISKYFYANLCTFFLTYNNVFCGDNVKSFLYSFSEFSRADEISNNSVNCDIMNLIKNDTPDLLIAFISIPSKFKYFLVENEFKNYEELMKEIHKELENKSKNKFQTLAMSAFFSIPFHYFLQRTFIPNLKKATGKNVNVEELNKELIQSIYYNRSSCPPFIKDLIRIDSSILKNFLLCIVDYPCFFGVVEHYEEKKINEGYKNKIVNCFMTYSQIILIDNMYVNVISLINDQQKEKTKKHNEIKKLVKDLNSISNFIPTIDENIIKAGNNYAELKKFIIKKFSPDSYPRFEIPANNETRRVYNVFDTQYIDTFDEIIAEYILTRKGDQQINAPDTYAMHRVTQTLGSLLDDERTYVTIKHEEFRNLIKICPVLPEITKLPKPIATSKKAEKDSRYFNLKDLFQFSIMALEPNKRIEATKILKDVMKSEDFENFSLRDKRQILTIIRTVEGFNIEHAKNRNLTNKLRQANDVALMIISTTRNILIKTAGYKTRMMIEKDPEDIKILQFKESKSFDPYEDPNSIFSGDYYNKKVSVITKYIPRRSKQTNGFLMHYLFKGISFNEFLLKRKDVVAVDDIFRISIRTDREKAIDSLEIREDIKEVVDEFFKAFRQYSKYSKTLIKILTDDEDPIQMAINFERFYNDLKFSEIEMDAEDKKMAFNYFLMYLNPYNLFSAAVYLKEYLFNPSSCFAENEDIPAKMLIDTVMDLSPKLIEREFIFYVKANTKNHEVYLLGKGKNFDAVTRNVFVAPPCNSGVIKPYYTKIMIRKDLCVNLHINVCNRIKDIPKEAKHIFCCVSENMKEYEKVECKIMFCSRGDDFRQKEDCMRIVVNEPDTNQNIQQYFNNLP